jgi:putative DNA primase/helicase
MTIASYLAGDDDLAVPLHAIEAAADVSAERSHADDDRVVPAPSHPMAVARRFLSDRYTGDDGATLLLHHRGGFHAWDGRCWPECEDRSVRAALYRFTEHAKYWKPTKTVPELTPFEPTRMKVVNALEALQAHCHLGQAIEVPCWLDDDPDRPAAGELVAMQNGLLHLPTRTLLPHSSAFYVEHALPFDYEPAAPEPERWLRFLAELWPDDPESIATLREIIGYILAGGTSLQKILALIGPKRSGKGTIARVAAGLLGLHNCCAPTLSALTQNFGLQPLVGKQLAVISDARIGSRADSLIAVERLLTISGEDYVTVDRKYKESWTGKLPVRFLILTNEIPRFSDASGALASRFVLLTMNHSFYGREDPLLTDKLLLEASAIFNWALQGLEILKQRGYFSQPGSAREALRRLEDLSSPVGAFIRDDCEIGPTYEVEKETLWTAWKVWCELEGGKAGTKAVFVRDLVSAYAEIKPRRPGSDGGRRQVLGGIRIREHNNGERPLTTPDVEAENGSRQGSSGVKRIVAPTSNGRGRVVPGDDGFLDLVTKTHQAGHLTTAEALERERVHLLVLADGDTP